MIKVEFERTGGSRDERDSVCQSIETSINVLFRKLDDGKVSLNPANRRHRDMMYTSIRNIVHTAASNGQIEPNWDVSEVTTSRDGAFKFKLKFRSTASGSMLNFYDYTIRSL